MSRRRAGLALAGLLCIVAAVIYATERWPKGRFAVYGPNLAVDIFGLVAAVVIIERIIRWQRERELEPVKIVATRRMATALSELMRLIATMYKASSPSWEARPSTIDALIDAWLRQVPYFNAATEAPVTPPRSWREELTIVGQQIEQLLLSDIDLYAEVLGTEMVVAVEDLLSDYLFAMLRTSYVSLLANLATSFERPVVLLFGAQNPESVEARENSAERMRAGFHAYEKLAGKPITVPDVLWRKDVSPAWGASRFLGGADAVSSPQAGPGAKMPRHEGA